MPITSTPRPVRRIALAGAAVTASIVTTACGAGFNAQTQQPYQAAEGTDAMSGQIAVRNMLVLASEDGKGKLYGAIVNTGQEPDRLVGIAAAQAGPPADGATAQPQTPVTFGGVRPLTLQPGRSVILPPESGSPVTVTGGEPGRMIEVTITFGEAGPITASIPVLTQDHYSPTPRAEDSESGASEGGAGEGETEG